VHGAQITCIQLSSVVEMNPKESEYFGWPNKSLDLDSDSNQMLFKIMFSKIIDQTLDSKPKSE
jgi:hypothetical protein